MVSPWKDTCGSLQWDRIQGELKPLKKPPKKSQQVEKIEVVSDDEADIPIGRILLFCIKHHKYFSIKWAYS